MKICIRLAKLLDVAEDDMHGMIARLVKATGIPREKVSELLHNGATQIKLSHLDALCDYLVREGRADEDDLPGALFAREPDRFWPILAARRSIHMCVGVRRDPNWKEQLLLIATDAELQAELIYGITAGVPRNARGRPHHSLVINSHLVLSPDQPGATDGEVERHARRIYRAFGEKRGEKALICLGSVKSNSVIEYVVSNVFRGARPFVSEDEVAKPQDRSCPFLMIYRPKAPRPKSCCGGDALSRDDPGHGPGLYYEQPAGEWAHCPWDDERSDAALIFYRLDKLHGQLEVVMGGFSVRGTRCLTDFIHHSAGDLGGPVYSDDAVDIGAYVLSFGFRGRGQKKKSADPLAYEQPQRTDIHPLSAEVIGRRLKRAR